MKKLLLSFAVMCAIAGTANTQCNAIISASDTLVCPGDTVQLNVIGTGPGTTLPASNTAGNNQRGNMFDIVATNTVVITGFDVSPMGNTTMEVYYKAGTWNGFANTPSAWTQIGSQAVVYTGGFVPVQLSTPVTIPAGQTYAFYITSNSTLTAINYSNGTSVGNVYSSDANITFLEGGGLDYPFTQNTGAVYQPRVWNGIIHYSLPVTSFPVWGAGQTTSSITSILGVSDETFTVNVAIPGCVTNATDSFTVIVSNPVITASASEDTLCPGNSVILYGGGGVSYSWNNGVTDSVSFLPAISNDYTVTGIDTLGCVDSATIHIEVTPPPPVSGGPDINTCFGGTIVLFGSGADFYSWDNNIQDSVPFMAYNQTYILTGTTIYGCIGYDTITVSTEVVAASLTLSGATFTAYPSNATSYQWYNCTTNTPVAGSTSQVFNPSLDGEYAAIVSLNGCVDTSMCLPVAISLAGIETLSADDINIYPNPAEGIVNISSPSAKVDELHLMDLSGKTVITANPQSDIFTADLSRLQAGVYMVRMVTEKGTVIRRIIKQ